MVKVEAVAFSCVKHADLVIHGAKVGNDGKEATMGVSLFRAKAICLAIF